MGGGASGHGPLLGLKAQLELGTAMGPKKVG